MSQNKKITQQQYSDARGYSYGVALDVGLSAACVYQQLIFWSNVAKGKWFYKSAVDLATELPISKATIDRSMTELKNAGYIEIKLKKANGAATRHIRVYSKRVNGFTQNAENGFTQFDQTYNNKEPINNNNKKGDGGLVSNKVVDELPTLAQPTESTNEGSPDHSLNSTADLSALPKAMPQLNNSSVASAKQENGRLTNDLKDVKDKLDTIFNQETPLDLLQQAISESNPETLKRTARWFSKQFTDNTDDFWATHQSWNNPRTFLTPTSKGTKYYLFYAERAMAAPRYKEDYTAAEKMWGPSGPKKAMF